MKSATLILTSAVVVVTGNASSSIERRQIGDASDGEAVDEQATPHRHSRRLCQEDPAWHPQYHLPGGWADGFCILTVDCDTPSYLTELACCKGAYGGQRSNACINALPNPPTQSPTPVGGLSIWYADYDTSWSDAGCVNTRPVPSGRPVYQSLLDCCKGAYAGQVSGE